MILIMIYHRLNWENVTVFCCHYFGFCQIAVLLATCSSWTFSYLWLSLQWRVWINRANANCFSINFKSSNIWRLKIVKDEKQNQPLLSTPSLMAPTIMESGAYLNQSLCPSPTRAKSASSRKRKNICIGRLYNRQFANSETGPFQYRRNGF